jgi:hypothetical protein
VIPLLKRFGLTNYPDDWAYMALAVALMVLSLVYVVVVLARRGDGARTDKGELPGPQHTTGLS